MTISYTGDVANASGFGCFNKILLKWKGSVYKLIYKVCILCIMYLISYLFFISDLEVLFFYVTFRTKTSRYIYVRRVIP